MAEGSGPMRLTRRLFLKSAAALGPGLSGRCSLPSLDAQGVASMGIPPAPRPKFSGRRFPVTFSDVGAEAGLIAPATYGSQQFDKYIFEANGPGIAFYDYDNDGWPDVFVPNGTKLQRSPAALEPTNHLYHNNRDGTFTDVTYRAGLTHRGWCYGVCIGDYDNDGYDDLFLTYFGKNVLYHNDGGRKFTDVTEKAGLAQARRRWATGCTLVDYDRDGWLDLFISHYARIDPRKIPPPGANEYCRFEDVPVACGPLGLPPETCALYRNKGDGTFSDESVAAGISKAGPRYNLTALAFDYDDDGWPDIFVACDSTRNLLFRNNHNGTLSEVGLDSGVATNNDGMEQANMGVAVEDYAGTGWPGLYVTHFSGDTPVLYQNLKGQFFNDVTLAAGLAVETAYVGWGTGFVDLDNDGWLDLFEVTGSIYPSVERSHPSYKFKTPRLVFRNLGGGSFEEVSELCGSGVTTPHSSRGCAFADFNNDGSMDVAVQNMGEPPSLLANRCRSGSHWINIKLRGTHSNRSAIGARIAVYGGGRRQVSEVLSGSSYISQSDLRQHFGLGSERRVEKIEVRWPSGFVEAIGPQSCDQFMVIEEGRGVVSSRRTSA